MTNRRQPFIINLLSQSCAYTLDQSPGRFIYVSRVLKTPNIFNNLIKFCLHVMKGTLRITLMLFDSLFIPNRDCVLVKRSPYPLLKQFEKCRFCKYYMLKIQPLTTSGTLFYHKTSYLILKQPIRGVQIRPFYNLDL